MCTTHTYDDKIGALQNALAAGLEICSGGIMGLGETMEDRINMCLDLRKLGVKSTPINVLNAIPGTPYENLPKLTNDEFCRIVAIYRFINPKAFIRRRSSDSRADAACWVTTVSVHSRAAPTRPLPTTCSPPQASAAARISNS